MSRPIVVVGNGIAGLTACDTLRAVGYDGELVVAGEERHAPYSRPALSKALLRDAADVASHRLPEPTHGATELLGVSATGLDVDRRRVLLSDGSDVSYGGLVVASGSRARRIGGVDSEELTLRTLDDALALRERLAGRPSVVVVGGGPLGMEVASGCLESGCEVALVADGVPLTAHLGLYLGSAFTETAVARGLKVVAGVAVDVTGSTVVLADGSRLGADLVVTAAGDLPNVEWLDGTGLLTDGRIVVDGRGRVRPDIVAAGDVAAIPTSSGVRRIPLWTSAIDQAKVAAAALLQGDAAPELTLQPYFWTEQFGLSLKAAGALPVDGAPEYVVGDAPTGPALMRWPGTAVAVNHRIPIPRLRRAAGR